MMVPNSKRQIAQVLAALKSGPMDRIRLTKTLFLHWYRHGQRRDAPFNFTPYLYGPFSFDLYDVLESMAVEGLIVHSGAGHRSSPYYLTEKGADWPIGDVLDQAAIEEIVSIAKWSRLSEFKTLLSAIYKEAPEFAENSIVRGVLT